MCRRGHFFLIFCLSHPTSTTQSSVRFIRASRQPPDPESGQSSTLPKATFAWSQTQSASAASAAASGSASLTYTLRPHRPPLDLLGQQLARQVLSVAKAAGLALAPGKDGAAGGEGEAMAGSSRHSDDELTRESLDLLRQQLVLLVATPLGKGVTGKRKLVRSMGTPAI